MNNENADILKLYTMYRNGEISENELTIEEQNAICEIYDRQIDILKKSNEYRKNKLIQRKNELDKKRGDKK